MRKNLVLFLLTMLLASGCNKIIDWYPVNLKIEVQNAEGQDLLNPENDLSWLDGTTIKFRGTTTELTFTDGPQATDLPANFYGFRLEKNGERYVLAYGEIDGGEEYDNDEFTLTWPDGTIDRITFKRRLNRVTIDAKDKWSLNGEKCSNPVVIVK